MSQRTALITGGAAGLGAAFSQRLARDGFQVAVADLADGSEVVTRIEEDGGRAAAFVCDVTDEGAVAALGDEVEAVLGAVDILVNCVGIFPLVPFEETSLELWERVVGVNLTGPFLTCKRFLPGMRERGWGRVVNVSSRTFWVASPDYSAYIAAKAGVIGLTRALATEYGRHGVTANVIAPGLTRTDAARVNASDEFFELLAQRQAIPRVPVPDDLVGVVSFLASDDSAFMTGQTFMVDGGLVRL